MAVQKGLGRGLGALFQDDLPLKSENNDKAETGGVKTLPLAEIRPNPNQPRKDFDQDALNELAESIKEQGLIQPITVRPSPQGQGYEIVAGERRWRASQLAGLEEVPVLVRELDEQQTLALALIENLQREDLNPLEEAWGMQRLRDEFGLSQEDLARQLGKSRSAVANCLRLLGLSENAQQDLRQGRISAGHARALLAFEDLEDRETMRKRISAEKLSVREVEGLAFTAREERALAEQAAAAAANSDANAGDPADAPDGFAAPGAAPEADNPESGANINAPADMAEALTGDPAIDPEAPAPVSAPAVLKGKKPRSAVLMELQTRISRALQLPVKISGQEDSGRLNIKFSSKEELEALLARLGLGE